MGSVITSLLGIGSVLIDRIFPDQEKRDAAKLELLKLEQSGELQTIAKQADVLVAEATGDSWLQRNWRPMIMTMFGFIIFNNYIIIPWLSFAFNMDAPILDIPPKMWSLIEIGLGGYIVGRSAEKVTKLWKQK